MDMHFSFAVGKYLEVERLAYGRYMVSLLRNCQTLFQSGCTILYSCQFLHILANTW